MEHVDLARFVEGFAIAFAAPFVRVIPSVIPWTPGAEQACAVLFVTTSPVFLAEDGPDGPIDATWYIVLEAPTGFRFPTENRYTDRCRGFGRYGGWDTYLQLPRSGLFPTSEPLSCRVLTARSIRVAVPATLTIDTRWSFRTNVEAGQNAELVGDSMDWPLYILEGAQLRHAGLAPSPYVDLLYDPEWLYEPGVTTP